MPRNPEERRAVLLSRERIRFLSSTSRTDRKARRVDEVARGCGRRRGRVGVGDREGEAMTAPKPRTVSKSNAITLDEWVVEPERDRSRVSVALREGENGERFATIFREIRFSPRHEWTIRKALSIYPEELEGLVEILDLVRERTGS
jgi:hypothetical protein